MKIILDNNLSPYIARALQIILPEEDGYIITSIKDKFGTGAISDIDWMKALEKEKDWIVISGDRRILKSPQEKHAYKRSGLIGIFALPAVLKGGVTKHMECILRAWPEIESISKKAGTGKIFTLSISGHIKPLKVN